jgi:glycosyltransferase involved in cell wall biosynthesis
MGMALKNREAESSPIEAHRSNAAVWHIITCEYPPQTGGVSDYTYNVASALAAKGDQVHVWCPSTPGSPLPASGVVAHTELGGFSAADLRRAGEQMDQFPSPRRILLQWVPHGYGYRSMNIKFCWWLYDRVRRHGDRLEIMAHEAYLNFRASSPRQSAAAAVHRVMTLLLMRAAERVWVSVPQWETCLRPYAFGKKLPFDWLPVPSNVAITDDPAGVEAIRRRYAGKGVLIGHFGTFGWPITASLEPILSALGSEPVAQTVLLIGRGSEEFRRALIQKEPRLESLTQSTGKLGVEDVSRHLAACDLLIQPYPDGVSGRRSSFMAGISHGKPVVTTLGQGSEDCWTSTGAVLLAPTGDVPAFLNLVRRLRDDAEERSRLGQAARQLYQERFELKCTISKLRSVARTTGKA